MPDKNKMAVFKQTNMTIYKTCTLCKHGEISSNAAWGYCNHPGHSYDHLRHKQRLPGVSHASMGCDDFELMHEASREMVELGPYFELLPIADDNIEDIGVKKIDPTNDDWKSVKGLIYLAAMRNDIRVSEEDSLRDVLSKVLRHLRQAAKASHDNCHCGQLHKIDGTTAKLIKITPGIGKTECCNFAESCRQFKEIYDNTQVNDDEDTTESDFEEAGRLTDSAVADAHVDDAEDE